MTIIINWIDWIKLNWIETELEMEIKNFKKNERSWILMRIIMNWMELNRNELNWNWIWGRNDLLKKKKGKKKEW